MRTSPLAHQDGVWVRCVSASERPLRAGGLQGIYWLPSHQTGAPAAFLDTYGMEDRASVPEPGSAIGSSRRAVGTVLPALTKVAWQLKGQEIRKEAPGTHAPDVSLQPVSFQLRKELGRNLSAAGLPVEIAGRLLPHRPRIGPFKALAFEKLTPETEKLYMAGFNASIDRYRELLADQGQGRLQLPNSNFDVGGVTLAGKYTLADAAYAKLMHKLEDHYAELPQALRTDLLAFYKDLTLPIATKANESDWTHLQDELQHLGAVNRDLAATGSKVSSAAVVNGR